MVLYHPRAILSAGFIWKFKTTNMGYYINKLADGTPLPGKGKAKILIERGGATLIDPPTAFKEDLVCVVDNFAFDAAGYCFCEEEFKVFAAPDGRSKRWLIVPNAKELAK